MTRENGYYWVKLYPDTSPIPIRWQNGLWWWDGNDGPFSSLFKPFHVYPERIKEPK